MRRHRWRWRIAVISPAVIVAGLAGAGLAGARPALASGASSTPSPCPSQSLLGGVCQTVNSLPSPGAILPSPVASAVSSAGSTVGSTVGKVTGSLGPSGSGGGGGGSGGGTGSGGTGSGGGTGAPSGSRSHAKGSSGQHPAGTTSALGPAGFGRTNLGTLSSLGVPGWLVRSGLSGQGGGTVPLSFPVVHPAANRSLAQAAVRPVPRAVSSLWLVFAVGVACLVGVAGGLGRLENRRRGARRPQN